MEQRRDGGCRSSDLRHWRGTTVGAVTAANSVRGTIASGGNSIRTVFDPVNRQIIIGRPADNIVTLFRPLGLSAGPFDFDGDRRSDLSVFRAMADPSLTDFYIRKSSDNQLTGYSWGVPSDKLAPADYDGDGRTDLAVYRDGVWYIKQSTNAFVSYQYFGLGSDTPVPNAFIAP